MQPVGAVLLEPGARAVEAMERGPRRHPVDEQAVRRGIVGGRPGAGSGGGARLNAGSPSRRVDGATPMRTARGSAGGVVAAAPPAAVGPAIVVGGRGRGPLMPATGPRRGRARPSATLRPIRRRRGSPACRRRRTRRSRRSARRRARPPARPRARQPGRRAARARRAVPVGVDPGRGEVGRVDEPRLGQHRPVERQRGLDAADLRLGDGPAQAGDRGRPVLRVDHQLGDQRVVLGRDPLAGLDGRVHADARARTASASG